MSLRCGFSDPNHRDGGHRLIVQNHTLVLRSDEACFADWFSGQGVATSNRH